MLREHFTVVKRKFHFAQSMDDNTKEEFRDPLEESIRDNCIGLMVKNLKVNVTFKIVWSLHH